MQEIDVIRLVAEGFSNSQIGSRLHITESAVSSRLHKIFKLLGARDRAHAVACAVRLGVLRDLKPHGSHAAVERHRYRKEELCGLCREGERERDRVRKRRERSPTTHLDLVRQLAGDGWTDARIARRLGCSESAVAKARKNAYPTIPPGVGNPTLEVAS